MGTNKPGPPPHSDEDRVAVDIRVQCPRGTVLNPWSQCGLKNQETQMWERIVCGENEVGETRGRLYSNLDTLYTCLNLPENQFNTLTVLKT